MRQTVGYSSRTPGAVRASHKSLVKHLCPAIAASRARQTGFTLVEAIIVITITVVIAGAVAFFIRTPVEGYLQSEARAELTDTADTALRRIARDVRLALPNSARISADGRHLELLLTKTGGRYLSEEDQVNDPANNLALKFEGANCATTPTDCQFDVVGSMPGVVGQSDQTIRAGDFIVVYNLGPGQTPADAYDCAGTCNRAQVANPPVGNRITMTANPFSAQVPSMRSPSSRFQVVTGPVSYVCDGASSGGSGRLIRYWNYTIQSAQPVTATSLSAGASARSAVLATNVFDCIFSYASVANSRSGLVDLRVTMNRLNESSERVVLFHQVHVDNTP